MTPGTYNGKHYSLNELISCLEYPLSLNLDRISKNILRCPSNKMLLKFRNWLMSVSLSASSIKI